MQYNFDEIIDRTGMYSAKYDERMKKFGREDVIPLWIADMDFKTAQPVIDACVARAEHGIFGYVSKAESYRQAAIDWEKRRHNWEIAMEDLSFCGGIVPALSELVREFTAPGDAVLIQTPVYPEFYDVVEAWEGRSVIENALIERKDGYDIDFADFEAKLKTGPKLFILCNPHNPVGRIWTRDELTRLLTLCKDYGVPVISDEIHGDLELFGNRYTPTGTLEAPLVENTIICCSATKTFNLAGLQACNVVFRNHDWKARFDKLWAGYDIHRNNCFSLPAMQAAWQQGDEWLDQLLVYIGDNMKFLQSFLQKHIPEIRMNLPQATYLAWLDCRTLGLSKDELDRFFVEQAGVGLNNGEGFQRGTVGFMRMNVACPRSVLQTALTQIEAAVETLRN